MLKYLLIDIELIILILIRYFVLLSRTTNIIFLAEVYSRRVNWNEQFVGVEITDKDIESLVW